MNMYYRIFLISFTNMINTLTKVIYRLYKPNIKQMYESYIMERERLIQTDYKAYGLPELSDRERIAETKFNIMKQEILTEYSIDDLIDFWTTRDLVKTSRLYDAIKRIPKGATLHIHDSASADYNWVLDNLMNEPNVYINTRNLHMKVMSSPKENYILIHEFLSNKEDGIELIKSRLQFNKVSSKGGSHEIWKRFLEMYLTPGALINYQPHFKKYLLRSLEDFKNENVSRVEYRHMLGYLYNLERKLTFDEEISYVKRVVDEFIAHNPGFSVGLIICGYKAEEPEVIAENVIRIYELVKKYPGFVLGYDLVGVIYM
jgi:adenosine deaminase CECR1